MGRTTYLLGRFCQVSCGRARLEQLHNVPLDVLQGVLLADKGDRMDSLNLLRCMAPLSLILLIPATLVLEPDVPATCRQLMAASPWFLPFLAANAATAYFVNLTNFMVTKHTSALTLQVRKSATACCLPGSCVRAACRQAEEAMLTP